MKSAVLIAALLLASCATHRYGRAIALTDIERRSLTCEQIEIEIEKCNAFLAEVNKPTPGGAAVLGFLGDFGIGNSMERSEARKSGMARLEELQALKASKGCPDGDETN